MCACSAGLYLRLRGVVSVVSVVVFTWHCGLDAGRVEETVQLLLLALSQAVDDAARLLLLLQAHADIDACEVCACAQLILIFFIAKGRTARMRLRHFLSHMRMVCLATSSSMVYSSCSLANSSSSWRDFLMSTERYDNMLETMTKLFQYTTKNE